ncbi:MAG: hypothetical protein FJ276_27250 [Planctomycetes bacterium]|nr:hypothetical protein [Planctomycetota bacterium]
MKRFLIVLSFAIAGVACRAEDRGAVGGPQAEVRSWTSTSGQKVEAAFVKLQSGYVYLRTAEGKDVMIALAELAQDDRDVARRLAAPPRPKPAERSNAGKYSGTYRSEGWSGALECELKDSGKDVMSAAWAAIHSDKKTYKYSGVLKKQSDGKYDGVFDVRRPKEFRVNGSFDAGTFSGSVSLVDRNGAEKKTGELSMTRKGPE